MSAPGAIHLNCPRCRLTLTARTQWLAVRHCPRCIARERLVVAMFMSTLPADLLYATDAARSAGEDDDGHGP
jgi:hypothetical protein